MGKYLQLLINLYRNFITGSKDNKLEIDLKSIHEYVFPRATWNNLNKYTELLIKELKKQDIFSPEILIYCLATIAVETSTFEPLREKPSKYSTRGGQPPFNYSAYDGKLGNGIGADGGAKWHGRGFIQLTGKANYKVADENLGLGGALLANPDLALQPGIAMAILVNYIKININRITPALKNRDFNTLRKIVNGGTHGLPKFVVVFTNLEQFIKIA